MYMIPDILYRCKDLNVNIRWSASKYLINYTKYPTTKDWGLFQPWVVTNMVIYWNL